MYDDAAESSEGLISHEDTKSLRFFGLAGLLAQTFKIFDWSLRREGTKHFVSCCLCGPFFFLATKARKR